MQCLPFNFHHTVWCSGSFSLGVFSAYVEQLCLFICTHKNQSTNSANDNDTRYCLSYHLIWNVGKATQLPNHLQSFAILSVSVVVLDISNEFMLCFSVISLTKAVRTMLRLQDICNPDCLNYERITIDNNKAFWNLQL